MYGHPALRPVFLQMCSYRLTNRDDVSILTESHSGLHEVRSVRRKTKKPKPELTQFHGAIAVFMHGQGTCMHNSVSILSKRTYILRNNGLHGLPAAACS